MEGPLLLEVRHRPPGVLALRIRRVRRSQAEVGERHSPEWEVLGRGMENRNRQAVDRKRGHVRAEEIGMVGSFGCSQ